MSKVCLAGARRWSSGRGLPNGNDRCFKSQGRCLLMLKMLPGVAGEGLKPLMDDHKKTPSPVKELSVIFERKRINASSTADAYALYADRLSYVQLREHRELRNLLCAVRRAGFRRTASERG